MFKTYFKYLEEIPRFSLNFKFEITYFWQLFMAPTVGDRHIKVSRFKLNGCPLKLTGARKGLCGGP